VNEVVRDALSVLALVGVVLALLLTLGLLIAILRSLWRVTFGASTLILPFGGGERAASLNEVLAEQLDHIEREWRALSLTIRKEEGASDTGPTGLDQGPVRLMPDKALKEVDEDFISDQPIDGQALPPLSFAGITFAPELLFNVFYRIRSLVARRMVRARLLEFGQTVRLSAVFISPRRDGGEAPDPVAGEGDDRNDNEPIVLVRTLDEPGALLDLIDDLAFRISKRRLNFTSEGERWSAYHAFLQGYVQHIVFLRTGQSAYRERAVEFYESAVAIEPQYRVAQYNLGALLYNRYTEDTNTRAIDLFRAASESRDSKLRALSLAALTLAYAQNVFRYGLGRDPWVVLADEASTEAVAIDADLEETTFARGWAHQINGRTTDAVDWYARTVHLEGDSPSERQIKSFAENNRAWLYMTALDDVETAEPMLRDALRFFPNKMAHANLGEIYKRRKQFDRALEEFADALRLDSAYAEGMNEMAMVYLAQAATESRDLSRCQSLVEQAERCHQRALDLLPPTSAHQLDELRKKFDAERSKYGFEPSP
jgi:tetratricopeptide (TPR) repeat protein